MALAPDIRLDSVELAPMRKRHLRSVLKIETAVYPRPWSLGLFLQEISRRGDRSYIVARWNDEVVGYGGIMLVLPEAHITTIAVDPSFHRRGIGLRLMVRLVDDAMGRGADSMTLEVRRGNSGAQRLYEKFGFRPVGVRKGYYSETGEDAIVMWADHMDSQAYADKITPLRVKAGFDV